MIKWTLTHTLYAVIMFLLLAVGLYAGQQYFIAPKLEQVEQSEQTLLEQQLIIDAPELDNLSKDSLQKELDAIGVQLPTEQNSAHIILVLNELEEQLDIVLQEINITDNTNLADQAYYPADVTSVNYQLSFTAESFADFKLFITELNNLEQLTEIELLNFQQTTTDGVTGSLQFRVFYTDAVIIE